jgi:endoglucanase
LGSGARAAGDYVLRVEGLPDSAPFKISADNYKALNAAAIKSFYLNRASIELTPKYAGTYARAVGHADTNVLVHESAASTKRPTGTVISAPKGWYDAGDYNIYVVNSGIATYTLLAALEHFPDFYKAQVLNIPESDNAVPDLLDEAIWNLEWMLAMQDPNDGGVYAKLTNQRFDGFVMPAQATELRYVVQKTTAAALDFAAVMAVASRVTANYETSFPGLSAKMIKASERAWAWAKANPAIYYQQPDDIKTGAYGDNNVSDEFAWAAAELYITTKNDDYYRALNPTQVLNSVPAWADVKGLAWISLAHHRKHLTAIADQSLIASRIEDLANSLLAKTQVSAYGVAMQTEDFIWGSNSLAANQAMMLIQAYRLNGKRDYLDAAQAQLDYILGRNATDYSFVTGFGAKPSMHPHHRISEADGVVAPVSGMLVGGPQAGQQDLKNCSMGYPSKIPAKSYLDNVCSYASNEIAINWSSPLVYVSGAIQTLTQK